MSSYLFSKNRAFYSWFAEMMQEGLSITCEKQEKTALQHRKWRKRCFLNAIKLAARLNSCTVERQCSSRQAGDQQGKAA
ncbi:MAG: hypothetical protein VB085_07155 [Peptococcaceae bacterium]|nr:hypothetical protein [Peptococcaceae bacterium]